MISRVRVGLAVAACATALAACAADDEGTDRAEPRKILAANEEPAAFARRMARLLATARNAKDCKEIYEINGRSAAPLPCPAPPELRRSMARFRVVGAAIYGTGGVVDYRSGESPDGAALVLYVAPNRRWGVGHLGLVTAPSVETDDATARGTYRTTVERYLRAVRTRDCGAFVEVAATPTSDRTENCRLPFRATRPLARRLERNPGAELKYEGGNASFGFFSIETSKPTPENSTIGVVELSDGGRTSHAVLDVAPAPTAEDMRQLREDIRIQKRLRELQPETSGPEPIQP